jgi:hypothetical protein
MPTGIYKRIEGRIYGNKGKHFSEETKRKISKTFKKNYKKENHPFYNKYHSKETKLKMSKNRIGKQKAEKNPAWKGDKVGYFGLHLWIKKHKPKSMFCEKCGKVTDKLDVANISGLYKRDISDFRWLCRSCHSKFDFPDGLIGKNL